MDRDQLKRKLAVILHADVVGSTSLVQKNESLAHERIQDTFKNFSEVIDAYGGIAREIRGDALVAEFERTSDAVIAAKAFQARNTELIATLDDDIKPELRVGISLGEVIIADNTITGPGVVLAQRLEQLAEPGGVVAQGSVSETVPIRLPINFESLGEKALKGFDQPVRAFSVILRPGEELPAPDTNTASQSEVSNDLQIPSKLPSESYENLIGERFVIPDKPSIAVLPFQNMSGDSEQEYFADGMSEDIITALSRVPDLVVIARNSTFVYKGRAVDIRQVGRELGVGHVLEGSIRKSGKRLRITAQLVDSQNGDHVWAERYDRKLDDIFAIQDEITHAIVVELEVKLVTGESSRFVATSTNSIEAWELVMRARPLVASHVHDNAKVARQLYERVLEIDSNYSTAYVGLGWIYWEESVWGWSSDPERSLQMAYDAAQKALLLNAQSADALSLLGHVYMVRNDTDQAIEMSEQAVELAPSDSVRIALLANVLIDAGRIKEGIQRIQKAIRLCPFPPAWYLSLLGTGFHLFGDNETAVSALEQAVNREPDSHLARVWLASTLAEMGKLDEAHAISEEIIGIEPTFSASRWAKSYISKSHERLKENLLAAGLPE
jgi:adenylate cyclase